MAPKTYNLSTQQVNGEQKHVIIFFHHDLNMASVASRMSLFTEIQYQARRDSRLKHLRVRGRSQVSLFRNTVTASTERQSDTRKRTPPV
jgi:hypothetical protein